MLGILSTYKKLLQKAFIYLFFLCMLQMSLVQALASEPIQKEATSEEKSEIPNEETTKNKVNEDEDEDDKDALEIQLLRKDIEILVKEEIRNDWSSSSSILLASLTLLVTLFTLFSIGSTIYLFYLKGFIYKKFKQELEKEIKDDLMKILKLEMEKTLKDIKMAGESIAVIISEKTREVSNQTKKLQKEIKHEEIAIKELKEDLSKQICIIKQGFENEINELKTEIENKFFQKSEDYSYEDIKTRDVGYFLFRGDQYCDSNKPNAAIEYYDKALELQKNPDILIRKADILLKLGKYHESIRVCQEAIDIDTSFHKAWYLKACSHAKQNEKELVFQCLKSAIELNSDYKKLAKTDQDLTYFFDNSDRFKSLIY